MKAVIALFFALIAFCAVVSAQPDETVGPINDLRVLNYALTLEHLEAQFYTRFQANFTSAQFVAAGFTAVDFSYFNLIRDHEVSHVTFLQNAITAAGGTPVGACTYDFSNVINVATYVRIAAELEATGNSAYIGALNRISDPNTQQAAATIAAIEARHAAYVNDILLRNPFPLDRDTALSPSQVVNNVAVYLASCPTQIELPTIRPGGVALDDDNDVTQTGPGQFRGVYTEAQRVNDINLLNYALILEHLEAVFYRDLLVTYNAAAFAAVGLNQTVFDYVTLIGQHEAAHVQFLANVITSRGGTPVPECTYSFTGVNSVATFLSVAFTLENTGATAYVGAANTATDTSLQQAAATIATVEARHTAYLAQLQTPTNVPFPNAFETPAPAATVAGTVIANFIASCPGGFNPANQPLPTVVPASAPERVESAATRLSSFLF